MSALRLATAAIAIGSFAASSTALGQTVLTYQQGVEITSSGTGTGVTYEGTQDAELSSKAGNAGSSARVLVDGSAGGAVFQGVISFQDIIGTAASQIPAGATVTSATLSLWVFDDTTSGLTYGTLNGPWSQSTVTYANLQLNGNATAGIQFDGIEGNSLGTLSGLAGSPVTIDVTAQVQGWANGNGNYGWGITPNGPDGWEFRSSEYGTASQRPLLTVTVVPEPQDYAFLSGLSLLGLALWRRSGRRG